MPILLGAILRDTHQKHLFVLAHLLQRPPWIALPNRLCSGSPPPFPFLPQPPTSSVQGTPVLIDFSSSSLRGSKRKYGNPVFYRQTILVLPTCTTAHNQPHQANRPSSICLALFRWQGTFKNLIFRQSPSWRDEILYKYTIEDTARRHAKRLRRTPSMGIS